MQLWHDVDDTPSDGIQLLIFKGVFGDMNLIVADRWAELDKFVRIREGFYKFNKRGGGGEHKFYDTTPGAWSGFKIIEGVYDFVPDCGLEIRIEELPKSGRS
jgi:hypothetical protein